ncbi:MAG: MBL fold metallo-hydrolase [Bacteroidota bacterium]|nr:MBL fold metallo-hydrolase [Bacteroidota bacterium]MDP4232622.1 MBL fold metallo-hydrolase [Bacteroidota bacterium]MDP4243874.1 MBL fold metallo-hydrolase [Bacteroidota bacterium]MDP4289282.1 MBL fold metallo-hydrolase [Bacteroidota bacterium]
MQIGPYSLTPIETGHFALDGGAMFGVVPKNLWSRTNPADEQNRIEMALRALLLQTDGMNILIDSGMGDKYDEKTRSIYKLDNSKWTLLSSLAERGLKPEDITHVIQTHLHFDHCGGLVTRTEQGELVPTFPNARVFVQKDNLAWARNPTEKDRASYLKHDWEPIASIGLLEELDGPGELFPGIELRIFNGHTRAQQLPLIHDEVGNHLFYSADLFPTKAHVNLAWIMGYDNFPLTTLEEKRMLLPEAYEAKWSLYFEHDAASPVARIESTPKGFRAA